MKDPVKADVEGVTTFVNLYKMIINSGFVTMRVKVVGSCCKLHGFHRLAIDHCGCRRIDV